MHRTKRSRDVAHHHPRVHRSREGGWAWVCSCGGASCRTALVPAAWRETVVGALNHAACLAP